MKIETNQLDKTVYLEYSDLKLGRLYVITSEVYHDYVATKTIDGLLYSIYPRITNWEGASDSIGFRFRELPKGFKVTIEQD